MLGRDILVLHFFSLLLRRREYLRQTGTEILLPSLHSWKPGYRRLAIVKHHLNVRAELSEQRTDNSLWLLKHRTENVLRLDLLILVALRQFYTSLDGLLAAQGKFF